MGMNVTYQIECDKCGTLADCGINEVEAEQIARDTGWLIDDENIMFTHTCHGCRSQIEECDHKDKGLDIICGWPHCKECGKKIEDKKEKEK